jgi:EAL domain-containing protein (putative c-di-GMP-specific phosphodiesterase class I)
MKNRVPLPATCLIELIDSQRFGVEYQPIIDLQSCEIFAYECLARFYDRHNNPIRPDFVYAS